MAKSTERKKKIIKILQTISKTSQLILCFGMFIKGQFSFQSQRKAMPRNAQTTAQLHSSHTLVMFKILQARLQQYMNHELSDVQAGFRKGRGTTDQIANIRWIMEKAREFQKNIYFCFIDYAKPLTVWITINCGKF